MRFKSGDEWTGNRNGRPKGPDIRARFTKEIVSEHTETLAKVLRDLGELAKTQDRWAVEKYVHYLLPYLLVKPKTEVDISSVDNVVSETTEVMARLSPDKITEIGKILYGKD